MVKNTAYLNTSNCHVFKCSNVSNATTVFNSQRHIHFLKITEERNSFENALHN